MSVFADHFQEILKRSTPFQRVPFASPILRPTIILLLPYPLHGVRSNFNLLPISFQKSSEDLLENSTRRSSWIRNWGIKQCQLFMLLWTPEPHIKYKLNARDKFLKTSDHTFPVNKRSERIDLYSKVQEVKGNLVTVTTSAHDEGRMAVSCCVSSCKLVPPEFQAFADVTLLLPAMKKRISCPAAGPWTTAREPATVTK